MTDRTPIIIPLERLDDDVLKALIEEFVTRDGTDYGTRETPLEQRCEQVHAALLKGIAVITFDPELQSATVVLKEHLQA